MPMQIIQPTDTGASAGSAIGQALQGLAQAKLQGITARNQQLQNQLGLQGVGFSPEQSQLLQFLEPKSLQEVTKQKIMAPQQQAYMQALNSLLGVEQSPQEQAQVPGMQQKPLIPAGINAQQATQLAQLALQKQKSQQALTNKKQEEVNKVNAPYVKTLEKGVSLSRDMNRIANEMQALLDTGKVSSGISGILPTIAQNEESQQFEALSNELASLLASRSGVATNFKIKLAQSMKPNLRQKPETQRALIQNIIKEAQKPILRSKLADQLIQENNGQQPANLQTKINERMKIYEELPDDAQEGDIYADDAGNSWTLQGGVLERVE